MLSKEDFILLTNNKSITLKNILVFFPPNIISDEAVEYISKYFNKEHVNNYDAFDTLEALSQYNKNIIKLFFEKN